MAPGTFFVARSWTRYITICPDLIYDRNNFHSSFYLPPRANSADVNGLVRSFLRDNPIKLEALFTRGTPFEEAGAVTYNGEAQHTANVPR
jgi:hypothetical protein